MVDSVTIRVREGQDVILSIGDIEHEACVERTGEGYLSVRLSQSAGFAFETGDQAAIDAVDALGIQRICGTLSRDERDPELLVLLTSSVDDIQRRQFVRVEVSRAVEVRRRGKSPVTTATVNVSGSGFLLAGPDDLKEGDQLEMSVRLSDSHEPLAARGEVVRITGEGHFGVRLLEIDERDRERLIQFCFERQAAPRVRLQ